jgi:hypothetical protein
VDVVGLGNTYKTTLTGIGMALCSVISISLTCCFLEMFHKELERVGSKLADKKPRMLMFGPGRSRRQYGCFTSWDQA